MNTKDTGRSCRVQLYNVTVCALIATIKLLLEYGRRDFLRLRA